MVNTLCFHCRGAWYQSLVGSQDPIYCTVWQKKQKKNFFFLSKGQKCSNKGACTSLTWESVGTLVTSGWRRGFWASPLPTASHQEQRASCSFIYSVQSRATVFKKSIYRTGQGRGAVYTTCGLHDVMHSAFLSTRQIRSVDAPQSTQACVVLSCTDLPRRLEYILPWQFVQNRNPWVWFWSGTKWRLCSTLEMACVYLQAFVLWAPGRLLSEENRASPHQLLLPWRGHCTWNPLHNQAKPPGTKFLACTYASLSFPDCPAAAPNSLLSSPRGRSVLPWGWPPSPVPNPWSALFSQKLFAPYLGTRKAGAGKTCRMKIRNYKNTALLISV